MKIRAGAGSNIGARRGKVPEGDYMLFDLETDPGQNTPIRDEAVVERMRAALKDILRQNDAPAELYERYGL